MSEQVIQLTCCPLKGVEVLIPPTAFEDFRGTYTEIWNDALYIKFGIKFVSDCVSVSRKGVLRGIHGDDKTWKLITCLYGAFYLVVVNNDSESPQFGQWWGTTLSDRNKLQVLVPPKFGNGHLVLTNEAAFHYKQSEYYDREGQFTIAWDDPFLGIYWPIANPILSSRDANVNTN